MRIDQAIASIRQRLLPVSESAGLDAQVLTAHVSGKSRTWLLAHPDQVVAPEQYERLISMVNKLEAGTPLPYVIGHWEFFGLDFILNQDVLIPRPETELLVEQAIHWLRLHPAQHLVVDVGTGSGCVAVSVASHIKDVHILAGDISTAALQVASKNAALHGVTHQIELFDSDLLEGLPADQPLDLICANLPYIPSGKLANLPVSKNEPLLALDGGSGGMEIIYRLLKNAPGRLAQSGAMLLEIEAHQGIPASEVALEFFPEAQIDILQDLAGLDRVLRIRT